MWFATTVSLPLALTNSNPFDPRASYGSMHRFGQTIPRESRRVN